MLYFLESFLLNFRIRNRSNILLCISSWKWPPFWQLKDFIYLNYGQTSQPNEALAPFYLSTLRRPTNNVYPCRHLCASTYSMKFHVSRVEGFCHLLSTLRRPTNNVYPCRHLCASTYSMKFHVSRVEGFCHLLSTLRRPTNNVYSCRHLCASTYSMKFHVSRV